MNVEICINCKQRPVHIKKRGLCAACYQRYHKSAGRLITAEHNYSGIYAKGIDNNREIYFIKTFFTHNNWTHRPALFHLGSDKYTPDFYDGERNVFIEVSGSRQAYHQNKAKYELFRTIFPKIKLEIRTPDGKLLCETDNGRKEWNNIQLKIA